MKRYGKTAVQQNAYYEVANIYEYMVESYQSNNIKQFEQIYKELNRNAKSDFIRYCFSEVHPQILQEIILKTI